MQATPLVAAMSAGTFPYRCSIGEICNSQNVCLRNSVKVNTFMFYKNEGEYFIKGISDHTAKVAYFKTTAEAQEFLTKTNFKRDFVVVAIPITDIFDGAGFKFFNICLLYTSPSPRDS